jgi:polyvinyl alcohol dehydrogenase (cytochrome)
MWNAIVALIVLLVAWPTDATAQNASEGERVYKQYCARCHDGSMPRMPSRDALRKLTPESIDNSLSSFAMRRQGAELRPAERRAVAEYLAGAASGSYRAPLDVIPKSAHCDQGAIPGKPTAAARRVVRSDAEWNGWGVTLQNTRFQSRESAGLTAPDIPRLKLKWAFGFPGVSASGSQATVVGGRVFVGSRNGMLYVLDAASGCIVWTFEADAGIRSTPIVGPAASGAQTVFFGDAHAQVYALGVSDGKLQWKVKLDEHLDAMITGAPVLHRGRLYVPVSSLEEGSGAMPTYECCTFRGSVVSLEAASGRQVWKTYTIPEAPTRRATNSLGTQLWGPSGAAVWSAPTLDPDRNRLYITTGDSYSNPVAPSSDAIMALAIDTGRILWVRQTLAGDAWNLGCLEQTPEGRANCPDAKAPDFDFGSSPVLATLENGRRLLVAGQKSGMLYALDPDDGQLVWEMRAGDGGVLGGIEWGFAADSARAYVALSSAFEKKPGEAGGIIAVRLANGETEWRTPPAKDTCGTRTGCNTAQPGAVTAIPGVVFSGSLDGHLRAYEAETGRVIWDVDTTRDVKTVNSVAARGGSLNGPGATVANGTVYVSSGYALGFMPGNLLLAFSVDGK